MMRALKAPYPATPSRSAQRRNSVFLATSLSAVTIPQQVAPPHLAARFVPLRILKTPPPKKQPAPAMQNASARNCYGKGPCFHEVPPSFYEVGPCKNEKPPKNMSATSSSASAGHSPPTDLQALQANGPNGSLRTIRNTLCPSPQPNSKPQPVPPQPAPDNQPGPDLITAVATHRKHTHTKKLPPTQKHRRELMRMNALSSRWSGSSLISNSSGRS